MSICCWRTSRAIATPRSGLPQAYLDQKAWNKMAVINVARSGIFAADRSIREYADNIWHVEHR